MNTPAYFVMDNLNKQIPSSIHPDLKEIEAEVYPNPFSNELKVHLNNSADEILLYDIAGKQLRSFNDSGKLVTLRGLGDLNPGIYFLKITTENQSVIKKMIKK